LMRQEETNFYAFVFKFPVQNSSAIRKTTLVWQMHDKTHTFYLMLIMYCYFCASFLTCVRYFRKIKPFQKSDLGLLQAWISVLFASLLVGLDDPFQALHHYFPMELYSGVQAVLQSSFVAVLMLFWLIAIHSISLSNLIQVDYRAFYIPKFIICGLLWLVLSVSLLYRNYNSYWDPTYDFK